METTKLTVEYLIVGILISLAIVFLVFNIMPDETGNLFQQIVSVESGISASLLIVFLPVSYGVGLVAEFLGLIMYEGQMRKVEEKRFPKYIQDNTDWIKNSPLLEKYAQKNRAIPKDSGEKTYGEMRFFILMNNSALYSEVESHINQARIIRVLTISELIFILGFGIRFFTQGFVLSNIVGILVVIAFLAANVLAIISRFERYCRSIERSFKVLTLANAKKKITK